VTTVGDEGIVLTSKVEEGGAVDMHPMLESIEARCDVRADVGETAYELSVDKLCVEILVHSRDQLHNKFKFVVNKNK
jgi:hypothetical protein